MLACQVDFVLGAVQRELHGFLGIISGEVVNQENLSFLSHVVLSFIQFWTTPSNSLAELPLHNSATGEFAFHCTVFCASVMPGWL